MVYLLLNINMDNIDNIDEYNNIIDDCILYAIDNGVSMVEINNCNRKIGNLIKFLSENEIFEITKRIHKLRYITHNE